MTRAEVAFWITSILVAYTYVGYYAIVWVVARVAPRPIRYGRIEPSVTVLIAAHNEAARIAAKIENCLALAYPPELLDIVVVSDGSTDATDRIVEAYAVRQPGRVRLARLAERRGKPWALTVGAASASGEVLLLADVRQRFEPTAVEALVRNFADTRVGAVSGELVLLADDAGQGVSLYWRYEKALRRAESRMGSTIGYSGAITAIRRSLFRGLPAETLLDDLVMALRVAARGHRVVFEPAARAVDRVSTAPGWELSRKERTLAGNLQTVLCLRHFVGALGPGLWWQFISHKLLRLVVPYALVVIFAAAATIEGALYSGVFVAQVVFYGLGALGLLAPGRGRWRRLCSVPAAFIALNWAAVIGPVAYLLGRRLALWKCGSAVLAEETTPVGGSVSGP